MPKAPITNDFAFGENAEKQIHYVDELGEEVPVSSGWEEDFDEDIDKDMSKTETYIRANAGNSYTTYVSADTPTEERRRMIIKVTLFAVIVVPTFVLLTPGSEQYVLLGIMAFTFATNFAITLMSANLEEKATSLELKTDTLLDELNSAASTLRKFQDNLESIDLEQLKENIETARTDIEPLMERIANPSLERIVANVESLMDYIEDVDLEKIDGMLQNYKKNNDIQPLVSIRSGERWDLLDEFPEENEIDTLDDEFYPTDDAIEISAALLEDDDMFFP